MSSFSYQNFQQIENLDLEWSLLGESYYQAGEGFGPQTPSHYLLTWINKGAVDITVEDNNFALKKGEVALIPGLQKKHLYFNKDTIQCWCTFKPKAPHKLNLINAHQKLPLSITMRSLFSLGLSFGVNQDPFIKLQRNMISKSMLAEYIRCDITEEESNYLGTEYGEQPAPIARCLSYMYIHHREELNLDQLAVAAEVSVSHLVRLFKQHMKHGPIKTLWKIRTEIAIRHLEFSGNNVSQIAEACGFKTVAHLSRLVKEESGLSPLQYRKKVWGIIE